MSGSTAPELADRLAALAPLLAETGVAHALMGGAAVMTYGLRARTRDLDFLVAGGETALDAIAQVADTRGWRAERKARWHLRLWSGEFFSDIIAGDTALERSAVATATPRRLGDRLVATISAEHLCAMKILAGRPQDLRDVGEIRDGWAELEVSSVNELLRPFGFRWAAEPGEVTPTVVELGEDR